MNQLGFHGDDPEDRLRWAATSALLLATKELELSVHQDMGRDDVWHCYVSAAAAPIKDDEDESFFAYVTSDAREDASWVEVGTGDVATFRRWLARVHPEAGEQHDVTLTIYAKTRLTPEIIEDRLRRGAENARALDDRLERVFRLPDKPLILKETT